MLKDKKALSLSKRKEHMLQLFNQKKKEIPINQDERLKLESQKSARQKVSYLIRF